MKLKDCKKGIYVLAKSKSTGISTFNEFLKYSPLGIGEIIDFYDYNTILVQSFPTHFDYPFHFRAKDLIELKHET